MGQTASNSSLHQLVRSGDMKRLKHVLRNSRSLDIDREEDQQTAVYLAVKDGYRGAVDLLLEHGANPDIICTIHENWAFPWSAMHESCWQGMTDILRKLISAGANVDLEAHHSMSPLHIAAWFGHSESIRILLTEGHCNVNHVDRFKESAIVMPVCTGDRETVRLLLMSGCRLNSRSWANIKKIHCNYDRGRQEQAYTKHGPFSLLTLAIKYAWLDIATLLLQHGFNANKYSVMDILEDIRCNVGTIDDEGQKLVECYLAAGYKFRSSDERELRYLLVESSRMTDQNSGQWSYDETHPLEPYFSTRVNDNGSTCVVRFDTVDSRREPSDPIQAPRNCRSPSNIPLIVFNPDPRVQSLSTAVSREFIEWLCSRDGLRNPHSLRQSCRVVIRNYLRVCHGQASVVPPIAKLSLPKPLQEYLILPEFGDPTTERPSSGSRFQKYLDTEKNLFAMPRRIKQQHVDVYVNFWNRSLCCWK